MTASGVAGELVDTHCHLFLMERPIADIVDDAVASGVTQMICAGIDPESSRRSIELAAEHPGTVFATAGMHPHTASGLDDAAKRDIEAMAGDRAVVAVGETGLDWFRMRSPRDDQLRSLAWHVALSNDSGKPLVVHVRDAWDDVLRVLGEGRAERVVIHCFSGDATIARECSARGYTLSFAANVTYPKNPGLRAAAAVPDRSQLVVETDSPFLPPDGLRGRENTPENAWAAARALAEERREKLDSLSAELTRTARAVFALS